MSMAQEKRVAYNELYLKNGGGEASLKNSK